MIASSLYAMASYRGDLKKKQKDENENDLHGFVDFFTYVSFEPLSRAEPALIALRLGGDRINCSQLCLERISGGSNGSRGYRIYTPLFLAKQGHNGN